MALISFWMVSLSTSLKYSSFLVAMATDASDEWIMLSYGPWCRMLNVAGQLLFTSIVWWMLRPCRKMHWVTEWITAKIWQSFGFEKSTVPIHPGFKCQMACVTKPCPFQTGISCTSLTNNVGISGLACAKMWSIGSFRHHDTPCHQISTPKELSRNMFQTSLPTCNHVSIQLLSTSKHFNTNGVPRSSTFPLQTAAP